MNSDKNEIVAALLWDVPTLRRGSGSARDFADALPGEADRWWEPREYAVDALGHAARAVAHERAGELDDAATGYAMLAAAEDPWARLLGLMLQAWSETATNRAVMEAERAAQGADVTSETRARLLAKVATYAFDEGQQDLGRKALADAIPMAPEASHLRRALLVAGANAGLGYEGMSTPPEDESPPDDPLVDYPWIEHQSLKGAERASKAEVERRARRAWTWQITLGGTSPLNDFVAAEVQATWAGALWLRPPIRRQLGGHLLTGAASSPQQWAYGVLMWALGAGNDPDRIYRFAEPKLDRAAVEFLVRTLWEVESRTLSRFLAVASEAWDALSDETLRWVIGQVEPVASDHPSEREVHRLWAAYAARLPDEWFAEFAKRPTEVQAALIESLGVGALAYLPERARDAVFEVAWSALGSAERPETQLLRVAAAATPMHRRDALARLVSEKASPDAVAGLVDGYRDVLLPGTLERAKDASLKAVRRQVAEAKEGQVSFGPGDARLNLGRLLAHLAPDPDAVRLLLDIAVDRDLPGEHILTARNALAVVRRAGRLPLAARKALHGADDAVGAFPEHGNLSEPLVRAARLRVLALELTDEEATQVVSDCRAPESRVRMISLATCAEAVRSPERSGQVDAFAWALVGGLFDPDDEVVANVLRELPDAVISDRPVAASVAVGRLLPLYDDGSVRVRRAVAELTRRMSKSGAAPELRLTAILTRSEADKSWLVRNVEAAP